MDYEKKYKEAIKEAAASYKDEDRHLKATLERIFPELKESEDERIRKEIIRLLHKGGYMSPEDKEKAFAWLEKQSEQKPAWNKEDEEELDNIIDFLNSSSTAELCPTLHSNAINWLKSLKDRVQSQPQWKPSDDQIAALRRLINLNIADLYDYRHLKRLLEQLEKL